MPGSKGMMMDPAMALRGPVDGSTFGMGGEPHDFFYGKASNPAGPSTFSDLQPPSLYEQQLQKAAGLPSEMGQHTYPSKKALHQAPPKDDGAPKFSDGMATPSERPPFGNDNTTVFFQEQAGGPSPADLANCAHSFLLTEVTAEIVKTSPLKFALKAVVFREDEGHRTSCTLKVRVFSEESNGDSKRLAVEIMKRQGDTLSFMRTVGQLASCLRTRYQAYVIEVGAATPETQATLLLPPPPPPPPEPEEQEADSAELVKPLITLASTGDKGALPVRAESVAALAGVGAAVILKALNSDCIDVASFVAGLLSSEQLDVVYQASRLAAQLAPLVSDGAMAGKLLTAALDKARAEKTGRLARLELANAVAGAARSCRREFSVEKQLREALNDECLCRESAVASSLGDALSNLQAHPSV
jgi:hypothetical protein